VPPLLLLTFPFSSFRGVAVQEGFSGLLGDPVELTQEVAAQGLSRVYRLGDAGAKQQLAEALVGSLTGTATKGQAKVRGGTHRKNEETEKKKKTGEING